MIPNDRPLAIHWFRRDLRLNDNHALFQALSSGCEVLPIFIFDSNILSKLEDKQDRRVSHIHRTLVELNAILIEQGSSLLVLHGSPEAVFRKLISEYSIASVYANHDHEPYAQERDGLVRSILDEHGIEFISFKDISIFERDEIHKADGTPYTVFTPYSKKWKAALQPKMCAPFPSDSKLHLLVKCNPIPLPTVEEIGFVDVDPIIPSKEVPDSLMKEYHKTRDFPALNGTSRQSVHLRFGTISVRALVKQAIDLNEKFLNELIWREFYMSIMWNFPHVVEHAFRAKYDRIQWEHNEVHYQAWCDGMTGYPLVDAGMRELNATGHMHNRVRMVVASFLTKHLLMDWRLGEAYFASKLLDFELSSNNGGWQWASGSGCDAAPYFRVFNPELQLKKFDPNGEYVRYWAPEWGTNKYPKPIIEHKFARNRAIERYKAVLKSDNNSTNRQQTVLF